MMAVQAGTVAPTVERGDKTIDEQIDAVRGDMAAVLERGKSEKGLSDEDSARFDELERDVEALGTRKAEEDAQRAASERAASERQARLDALATRFAAPARVTSEPGEYVRGQGQSFFADLWRSKNGDYDAATRLQRNNAHRSAYPANGSTRALNTTYGAAGEFVPPLWLENEYIALARAGRAYADLSQKHPLPGGTDSINIPRISTGTQVLRQGTQNTTVNETDLTTGSISVPVVTLAGGQTVSMQLVEQSPIAVDEIVLQDMAADYSRSVDAYCLSDTAQGAVTNGQQIALTGTATGAAGAGAVYRACATQLGAYQTARFMPPTHWVMHPRRWYWFVGTVDANGRPFVVPNGNAYNPLATVEGNGVVAQGVVGTFLGLPVVLDPSVPINLGVGTNQDAILLQRSSDVWLMEGSVKAGAFEQTYANQLSLYFRLYNYAAFTAVRYAGSVQVITGTQLNILT